MLKEAKELSITAVLRIFRKAGRDIGTDSIINALTTSHNPPSSKEKATVQLPTSPKSKPSGQSRKPPQASPTVPFQDFKSQP